MPLKFLVFEKSDLKRSPPGSALCTFVDSKKKNYQIVSFRAIFPFFRNFSSLCLSDFLQQHKNTRCKILISVLPNSLLGFA